MTTRAYTRSFPLRRELPALSLLGVLAVLLFAISPAFRSPGNLLALSLSVAVIGIMACGEAVVLIIGGIDLSVASILVLSAGGASAAMMEGCPLPLSILSGLAIGLLAGGVNGGLISFLRLPPIVVTLATFGLFRAVLTLMTNAREIGPLPSSFVSLGLGVAPLLLLGLTATALAVGMGRAASGRRLYALGGNEEACRTSGLPVPLLRPAAYVVSGGCAALAGILVAASSGALQSKAATGYELDVIAACVIGGVSLQGGQGSIAGAIAGAALLRLMSNALLLLDIPVDWYRILIAVVLLAAAAGDRVLRGRSGEAE